jgi:hypothetical protein
VDTLVARKSTVSAILKMGKLFGYQFGAKNVIWSIIVPVLVGRKHGNLTNQSAWSIKRKDKNGEKKRPNKLLVILVKRDRRTLKWRSAALVGVRHIVVSNAKSKIGTDIKQNVASVATDGY